eukprot:6197403-Pleurochrysis_carterae.AAC.3
MGSEVSGMHVSAVLSFCTRLRDDGSLAECEASLGRFERKSQKDPAEQQRHHDEPHKFQPVAARCQRVHDRPRGSRNRAHQSPRWKRVAR